jgi:hypothetical protein
MSRRSHTAMQEAASMRDHCQCSWPDARCHIAALALPGQIDRIDPAAGQSR